MKIYLFIFLYLGFWASSIAQTFKKEKLSIAVYGDYLIENFQWSIAGNSSGHNPNILSEVKWKDLKLRAAGLDFEISLLPQVIFSGKYHRASIHAGTATDTDYTLDNRTNPSYNALLNADEGSSFSYSGGLGYRFIPCKAIYISSTIGYFKSSRTLFLKDHANQTRLNSTYQSNWTGPEIGLNAGIALKEWLKMTTGISYAQLKYTAFADWNLIDAFEHPISFSHQANGYQSNIRLQFNFQIIRGLSIFLRGNYSHAATGKGTDKLFLIDGRTLQSRFNGAIGNSKSIGLGFCYTAKP